MSYIGRGIDQIDNISTLDNLSFNGSDATFNLTQNSVAFTPVSADALQIQIDGIIQSGNYTVSGSTVTFDFTPSGSSVCNGIKHFGVGVMTSVSDGAVTEAKIGSLAVTQAKIGADAVNGTKIADDSISDEHLDITAITGQTAITSLADTDKFLVSDASDSGNLKYVEKQYLPKGGLVLVSSGNGTSAASLQLESVFSTTYTNYLFIGTFQPATNAVDLKGNYVDGTTVKSDSEYRYSAREWKNVGGSLTQASIGGWNADHIRFNHSQTVQNSGMGQNVRVHFFNPMASSTTNTPGDAHLQFDTSLYADDSNVVRCCGFANYQTSADYNGFRFIYSSGNISAYNYSLFGITGS